MPLSEEEIIWAYRLFYDREPENQEAIAFHRSRSKDIKALRKHLLGSSEFKDNNEELGIMPYIGDKPPMHVDTNASPSEIEKILEITQAKWQKLGEQKPHWSVVTIEEFQSDKIDQNEAEFYRSGKLEENILKTTLERSGIDLTELKTCLELGCGVGRVTRWLAESFEKVYAYDISEAHLEIARKHFEKLCIQNTDFLNINAINDFETLPMVDLFYSIIVLQHNPPPVIEVILDRLLKSLKPNGIGFFQLPTYSHNYAFATETYLEIDYEKDEMEVHFLPQKRVFEILKENDCDLLEVIVDPKTGFPSREISNSFLIKKKQ